jgi:glycosyltransferase involved in cell wall biosynthesis
VRWFPEATERLDTTIEALPTSVKERIVRTGYVNDRDKLALLSGATVLAYPSLYEGFGFPVLEAFAAGVPVMTSNVSSLPEVAGEAAVLVDPADVHAIAKALSELVGDADLRAVLSAAGVARASRFTWEATARAMAAVLREAVVVTGTGPAPEQAPQ